MATRAHLGTCTTASLTEWALARGAPSGSAAQLARHLVGRFAQRRCRGQVARRLLAQAEAHFEDTLPHALPSVSADGTTRFAARLSDGQIVETVIIPHGTRTTVCLSTQAGCARGCVFCETGRLGLGRNLHVDEITGQFALASQYLLSQDQPRPTNAVFMGMGEPLDNLEAVLRASEVLSDPCGFRVAPRRITVSTVGVVPKMRELYRRSSCRLAVSLHSADPDERARLLPVARIWSLEQLRQAIGASPQTVLLQVTLIEGVNDRPRDRELLARFCDGLDVRVNLIPLNPGPDPDLHAPSMADIRAFQWGLQRRGIRCFIRTPHGRDVGGACGQLAGARRPTLPLTASNP